MSFDEHTKFPVSRNDPSILLESDMAKRLPTFD